MLLGVFDELVDIRRYFVHTAVHGGNGIALALYADALSHNGAEIADCRTGGTTAVHPGQIAAEDEDLVGVEGRDMFGACIVLLCTAEERCRCCLRLTLCCCFSGLWIVAWLRSGQVSAF